MTSGGQWLRLDRRTLWLTALVLFGLAASAAMLTAIFLLRGGVSGRLVFSVLAGGVGLVVVGGVLVDLVRWRYTFYRIGEQRIERRFTFVFRTHKSVPLDRVRSVDINAPILHRLFGLAKVKIGTGQRDFFGEVAITFDPLDRSTAERLRGELLRNRPGGVTASDGEQSGEESAEPLAELRWSWLRYAPISVTTPVLGASAFGGLLQVADWFDLQGAVFGIVRDLFRELSLIPLLATLVAVGLVVGVVASIGLWIELWWAYRLSRETGTLLVRRGLLTTRSLTLEEGRLRGIEVVEPLGARLSGGARLDVVASGLTMRVEERHHDPRTLLPVAPRELAHRLAAEILREPVAPTQSVRLVAHPPAARRRRIGWAVAAVVAFAGSLALLGAALTDALLHLAWGGGLLLLPIAVALALDAYRGLGHGITGKYLVARRGSVRRSTVALLRDGVIGWQVTSSPMQRRVGLVTLTATSAANHGAYRIPDVGLSEGLAFADTAVPGLLDQFIDRGTETDSRPDQASP